MRRLLPRGPCGRVGDRKSTVLALDFSAPTVRMDLRVAGEKLLQGDWDTKVSVNGRDVEITGPWDACCWDVDSAGQYLELHTELAGGGTLERQIYLGRKRGDASRRRHREVGCRRRSDRMEPPTTTRTGLATACGDSSWSHLSKRPNDPDGTTCILRLPGWNRRRVVSRGGAGYLRTRITKAGPNVLLPLFIGLDHDPREPTRAWRSLTISNDRRRVADEEAVAFRIPYQGRNILFFRALMGVNRYAFLGHQTWHECLVGSLKKSGMVDEWLCVDPEVGEAQKRIDRATIAKNASGPNENVRAAVGLLMSDRGRGYSSILNRLTRSRNEAD